MLCNMKSKKLIHYVMLAIGIISLAYGVIGIQSATEDAHDYSMLLGMFSGFGAGILAVAIFFLIRGRVVAPEKLKQKEIEENDERNIAIKRAAFTVSWLVALLCFAVLTFVFVAMGMRIASYLCLGAMYLQFFSFLIAHKVYEKKM